MTDNRPGAWQAALSRRTALTAFGASMAGLATARMTSAQEATPDVEASASRVFTMFVQTAQAGTCVPVPDRPGVYEVTLAGVSENTIYFSDRPERIVGTVPTDVFLDAIGFLPDNPPNAAIVAQTADGQDVLVVALQNPRWDGDAQLLTYEAEVLEAYTGEGLTHLAREQDDSELPAAFGHTSLFVDDCPDVANCYHYDPVGSSTKVVVAKSHGPVPGGPYGTCWSWGSFDCVPCGGGSFSSFDQLCNETYPTCKNGCFVAKG